ncbi:MAG: M23 family metallopeptidase [Candidatus Zixiibacteriota bacterium]|nr:MAG: M23 family metallopeptidase [candidate division Zixibacteria bacterium]
MGREVFSPVDGYIWRIRYSYIGYGKALYLKDRGGNIYVFGHLSKLSQRLENVAESAQYSARRYYLDLYFSSDSLTVTKGELIAFSGQSGYGAPHLHFEKRTPDNQPQNPLTNGFALEDDVSPSIEQFALIYQDSSSLFPNGRRRSVRSIRYDREQNAYVIDSVFLVQGHFGVAVKAFDRIRHGGPHLNIYRARLYVDDYLYYENIYEQYDYAETGMVDLLFDYSLLIEDIDDWHLLYSPAGKNYGGSNSLYRNGGVFAGATRYSYGKHSGRVEVFDAAGNRSELRFQFVFAPPDGFFTADRVSDSVIYLRGRPENNYVDIARVGVYGHAGSGGWKKFGDDKVETRGRGDYRVIIPPHRSGWTMLMIRVEGTSGWIRDDLYLPLARLSKSNYSLAYKLESGGVRLMMTAKDRFARKPRVEVVYEDGYVREAPVVAISAHKFAAFHKAEKILTNIVRFNLYEGDDMLPAASHDVILFSAGSGEVLRGYSSDETFEVIIPKSSMYSPALLEIHRDRKRASGKALPNKGDRIGRAYAIAPESVPLAGEIGVVFRGNFGPEKEKFFIYWLNDKDEWKLLPTEREAGRLSATSDFLGTFAVLEDTRAPRVKKIFPGKHRTVKTGYPRIHCIVTDDLSGIEDDSNISVFIDDAWSIPEYDPETEVLKTSPRRELADGKHELKIIVSDRVGNSRTVYSDFYVNTKKR